MNDDVFSRRTIAYLVGGPADGAEHEVRVGDGVLRWAEYLPPLEPATPVLDEVPTLRRLSSLRVHEYRPCVETGEWLWQGVK